MSEYISNTTGDEIVDRLLAASALTIITHRKPDGDAMGSALALSRTAERLGKAADILLSGPVETSLTLLAGSTSYRVLDEAPVEDPELILVVDTGAVAQLEPFAEWLRPRRDRIIGIDHHARGDDVAGRRLIDVRAASTTQMLVPIIERLGVAIDGAAEGIGEALFAGLATDTGWFRHSNADGAAFAAAAHLLNLGVDKSRLYQMIEETHRPARLALAARALASIEYAGDGRVAIQRLGLSDFEETGGDSRDLTGLVNEPLVVGRVRVSILLVESETGTTKVSFRAKPGAGAVDVNELAHEFGGGGHVAAAGARLKGPLDEAVPLVREAAVKSLSHRSG